MKRIYLILTILGTIIPALIMNVKIPEPWNAVSLAWCFVGGIVYTLQLTDAQEENGEGK
ncbi:hypothetical protein LCGC14_0465710 [marine sediment metagenome]|uniref:Uncharacterized protein n=1 Tax=marine sediment metagenome TaxID=412755 RepID=A0A0F9SWJ9_9ZZZZ